MLYFLSFQRECNTCRTIYNPLSQDLRFLTCKNEKTRIISPLKFSLCKITLPKSRLHFNTTLKAFCSLHETVFHSWCDPHEREQKKNLRSRTKFWLLFSILVVLVVSDFILFDCISEAILYTTGDSFNYWVNIRVVQMVKCSSLPFLLCKILIFFWLTLNT